MTRARRWLFNGILLVVAMLMGVALGELGLRWLYPQRLGVWHQDRSGLALHWPNLVTHLPQFGQTITINSAGMRDREHDVRKPAGVYRVLVLGDSFMEALQLPFEATFPHLVERALDGRDGRRVEVINASVSGWGTDDELKYLIAYGLQWKPDLVLVAMTLHNDINDNLRRRFHMIRDGQLVEQPARDEGALAYGVIQLKGFLAARSHLYQLVIRARRLGEMRTEARLLGSHVGALFHAAPGDSIEEGTELTARLLERMRERVTAEGGRLVVVLLPLSLQLSDARFREAVPETPAGARPAERTRPQRLMLAVGDRLGIPMIDLLPEFDAWVARGGAPLYLEHDGHWNEHGHRLGAAIATRELVERRLVR